MLSNTFWNNFHFQSKLPGIRIKMINEKFETSRLLSLSQCFNSNGPVYNYVRSMMKLSPDFRSHSLLLTNGILAKQVFEIIAGH